MSVFHCTITFNPSPFPQISFGIKQLTKHAEKSVKDCLN